MAAGEIAAALKVAPSTLSFHLAALEQAGLVQSTRQGRQIIYAVRFVGLRELLELPDRDLLRRPAGTVRRPGAAASRRHRRGDDHDASLQRAVSLHAQFGALDHGRSHPGEDRQGQVQRLLGRLRAGASADARGDRAARRRSATTSPSCAASHGTSSPGPTRRAWISSSRSATRCDGQACPDFGERPVTAAWPLPGPGQVHRHRPSSAHPAQRALRHDPAPARDLHQPALRLARPHGAEGAARRNRRQQQASRHEGADHEGRHQRHGPHRPPGLARGDGRHRSGRRTIRAPATGSTSCTSTRSRAAPRRPRICSSSTASTAAGATSFEVDGDDGDRRRRQAHRLQRRSRRRARSPGAISAATSCWNAPASS